MIAIEPQHERLEIGSTYVVEIACEELDTRESKLLTVVSDADGTVSAVDEFGFLLQFAGATMPEQWQKI